MNTATLKKAIRTPSVYVPILIGVVVLVVWLFALFLPQGSKLSKLNAQEQTLQQKQEALQAHLAQLRKINPVALTRLNKLYTTAIPPTVDDPGYQRQIQGALVASGVNFVGFTPPSAPANGATTTVNGITPLPVSLVTSGTYDQELTLMRLLYKLPRLTVINSVQVGGGGPKTNRSTLLSVTLGMTIYEAPPVSGVPTSSASPATP